MRMVNRLLLTTLLVLGLVSVSSASLVTNGSFETPDVPGTGSWTLLTTIPGWTLLSGSYFVVPEKQVKQRRKERSGSIVRSLDVTREARKAH